ncbi:MAG: DNA recombination protein RmuC [Elusimicrobiota bacterium]
MFSLLITISCLALGIFAIQLVQLFKRGADNSGYTYLERLLRDTRDAMDKNARMQREEIGSSLKLFNDSIVKHMTGISRLNEEKFENMRVMLEERIRNLQEDNNQKLEKMRETVDEKLHATLEKRLGDSFKVVSERLEAVYKGLGEMQSLASNVGDLKRVLTNVKTRGTWGEIQLGALLEQILTQEQYSSNVITKKGSNERVEFAIKLPGRNNTDDVVWLPIDAKFPQEDYQRLQEAEERGNHEDVDQAIKQLETRIKLEAKAIQEKYLDPPNTTDFGIMFLPTEGLYAEVIRRSDLCEKLQRECRIIVTGPTTLSALLNSLQMGFRTLVIERRSSEVWNLLGAVKNEFGKFGDILDKTQKKLMEAHNTIEDAAKKSRTIQRKLKDVEEIPAVETSALLEDVLE